MANDGGKEAKTRAKRAAAAAVAAGLPYFERPPVVETVLGVHFDPLPGLRNVDLVLAWQMLGEEHWPSVVEVAPLPPISEKFGDKHKWAKKGLGIKVGTDISMRLQIKNVADDRMVQMQNGRFHYNWRKQHEANEYPRYATVRSEFDSTFERFQRFVRERKLGEVRPNQWELTYVNHIEQGALWQLPTDWYAVLPGLLGRAAGIAGIRFESTGGESHFELEPERGRLHISLRHGRGKGEGDDESEFLVLELTARGPITATAGLDLDNGLNLGHETIVSTFVAITSDKAQRHWVKRQ